MPKLINESTGEVIKDNLTAGEIEELSANGVDIDVPESDYDPSTDSTVGEASDDEVPDDLVQSDVPDSPDEVEVQPGEDDDGDPIDADIVGGEAEHILGEDDDVSDRDEEHIEDRFDVKLDEITKADHRDRDRWASLINQLSDYGTDVETRKRERDERIEDKRWTSPRDHASLRNRAERNGIISDLKDGFRQMVSRPTPQPATSGPRLDAHNVARRAAGDVTVRKLFEEEVQVETGDRCIGLATDISGSMGSDIDDMKITGGAIAEATEIIGDDFVWEAFTDTAPDGLDLRIINGPQEDWDWEFIDSFGACAAEPTAAGIRDCRMLMEQTDAHEYLMIVITDGQATVDENGTFHGHGSNVPVEHAREAVRETREAGIDVMGIGIGSMSERKMEETFGQGNYQLTNINDLAEDILSLYADQMEVNRGGF